MCDNSFSNLRREERQATTMTGLLIITLAFIPLTVGGLAMFLKFRKTWLRIAGLTLFGASLLGSLILPAVLRGMYR
jgi:hypothetical protein